LASLTAKIKGYVSLMRLKNSVMMGIAVIIGEMIVDPSILVWHAILGFYTAFSLTAAAMVLNDYFDMAIDSINEPGRPLPQGLVSKKKALIFSLFLNITGLISAYNLGLTCLVIAALFLALSTLYNSRGKSTGLLGNLMVSACVAAPFLYGGFAAQAAPNIILMVFAALAFISNTGREVTKGIVDVEGDKSRNIRTVAIRRGSRAAASTAITFYLISIILSFLPLIATRVNYFYLPLILITDTGFLYSSLSLMRNPTRENSRKTKKMVLVWMLFGLLSLILGGLKLN
jgi:geranylgeranylglycerol-phosphate geranylgeranyltransferase